MIQKRIDHSMVERIKHINRKFCTQRRTDNNNTTLHPLNPWEKSCFFCFTIAGSHIQEKFGTDVEVAIIKECKPRYKKTNKQTK